MKKKTIPEFLWHLHKHVSSCLPTSITKADAEGDGLGNQCDNCLRTKNASQVDIDNDGRGNACDLFMPLVVELR